MVKEAREQWGLKLGCKLGDGLDVTLLAFAPVDNPAVAPGIVNFNWAVWAERSDYLPTLGYTPDQAASVRRILLRAGARMPVEKKSYGERSEKALADFARNPPRTAWIFFTDGSALGNPGPCGGGYVCRDKDTDKCSEAIFPLGHGDNNKGEMGGIQGSLRRTQVGLETGGVKDKDTVYIFSDSALCIGYLDRGWHFPHWKKLAKTLEVSFWISGNGSTSFSTGSGDTREFRATNLRIRHRRKRLTKPKRSWTERGPEMRRPRTTTPMKRGLHRHGRSPSWRGCFSTVPM